MNSDSAAPSRWKARRKQLNIALRSGFSRLRHCIISWNALIIALGILLLLGLICLAITPVRYDLSVGMVPTHTITANRDVVDEITTEELRRAAAEAVTPTYHYSQGVSEAVIADFEAVFSQLDTAVQYSENLSNKADSKLYTADELNYARTIITLIDLKDYQLTTLLNTSRADLTVLHSTLSAALINTLSGSIAEEAESVSINSIMRIVGYRVDTSLLQNVVLPVLQKVVRPNMIIDQAATAQARSEARNRVEPVIYKQGQNIIVKGEGRVERYQYVLLANLGLLHDGQIDINIYLGAALLVMIVLTVALVLLRIINKPLFASPKPLMLLFVITVLTVGFCVFSRRLSPYFTPTLLGVMLLTSMLGVPSGIVMNAALALLISALAAGGSTAYTSEMVYLIVSTLCSGTLLASLLRKRTNRLHIIFSGILASVSHGLVLFSLSLMTTRATALSTEDTLWFLGSPLLAGLLCIALQPLLEAVFNLATPAKLLELSNPNHPLLRRLLLEAPGTYHHSIVVANLSEAAAEAVGADPLLARVGGYYHDIGKLRRPLYFKENQLGTDNRLDAMDPYTAAQIILAHTKDGVTLARNYHLPSEVLTIIAGHHGNTPVAYFYSMARKAADGKEVNEADFRYDAVPPSTKEGAIVLLCDTIEAAVRSMNNPTPDTIEEFILKLTRGKLQDGQLSQSPLTLRDMDAICQACITALNGVFHERIEYPDLPDTPQGTRPATETASPKTDQELTKPWDGFSADEAEQDDSASDSLTAPPAAPADPLDDEEFAPRPILVDPSQFEPDAPLPPVLPPVPEAPLTIDDALERVDVLSEAKEAEADDEPVLNEDTANTSDETPEEE